MVLLVFTAAPQTGVVIDVGSSGKEYVLVALLTVEEAGVVELLADDEEELDA